VARSREEGRGAVEQLVAAFSENLDYYKSPEFDETSARQRFIDPFFSALGWDVADQAPRGPCADVILEFSLHDPAPTEGSAEADQTEEEAEDLRVATALAERTDTGPIGVRRSDRFSATPYGRPSVQSDWAAKRSRCLNQPEST
jgi:hypothetical protein